MPCRGPRIIKADPGLFRHDQAGDWIEPVPMGATALPGIAVVHAIVLTADDRVLLAQRASRVGYAPGHWSASFEEQLNDRDFGAATDPFTHAACRGFREEFGAEVAFDRVTALSAILQVDLLNVGIAMLLRPVLTAAEIEEQWRSDLPTGAWEAEDLRSVPLAELDRLGSGAVEAITPLHVTSGLRCSLLQRWVTDQG